MALREFTDSRGRQWKVWTVNPTTNMVERRGQDRRSPEPVIAHRGEDRRSGKDRRGSRRSGRIGGVSEWLAFESDSEKRRLMSVPRDWEEYSIAELEDLCLRAAPVRRSTGD